MRAGVAARVRQPECYRRWCEGGGVRARGAEGARCPRGWMPERLQQEREEQREDEREVVALRTLGRRESGAEIMPRREAAGASRGFRGGVTIE